ncbi:UNVERIFIED_ORG: hypothetical protein J2R75_005919 [Bradyrhizobium elkanii]|nr:hypothetical protein [Bradyrhizobium japonicum]
MARVQIRETEIVVLGRAEQSQRKQAEQKRRGK